MIKKKKKDNVQKVTEKDRCVSLCVTKHVCLSSSQNNHPLKVLKGRHAVMTQILMRRVGVRK